jgi:hypothetical protein
MSSVLCPGLQTMRTLIVSDFMTMDGVVETPGATQQTCRAAA